MSILANAFKSGSSNPSQPTMTHTVASTCHFLLAPPCHYLLSYAARKRGGGDGGCREQGGVVETSLEELHQISPRGEENVGSRSRTMTRATSAKISHDEKAASGEVGNAGS